MSVVHLSETGLNAGRRFCFSTADTSVHGMYAPLENPVFRAKCCLKCLVVWAIEGYEDDDEMPQWVKLMREEELSVISPVVIPTPVTSS